MDAEVRQFLLTAIWLFSRHGQGKRAQILCEALVEADPQDGVAALALAEQLLEGGESERALAVLRSTDCPSDLRRAEALLETRALSALGRKAEATRRWQRFLASIRGAGRSWVES